MTWLTWRTYESPAAERARKDVERRVLAAVDLLDETGGGENAARMLRSMLEDDLARRLLMAAAGIFDLRRTDPADAWRRDMREAADRAAQMFEDVLELADSMNQLHARLGSPDSPTYSDVALAGMQASEGVYALACMARNMDEAAGPLNQGRPPDPAKAARMRFEREVVNAWTALFRQHRAQDRMLGVELSLPSKGDRKALEQVIAALYETLVGDDEEMPGRAKLGSRVSSYLNVHFGR